MIRLVLLIVGVAATALTPQSRRRSHRHLPLKILQNRDRPEWGVHDVFQFGETGTGSGGGHEREPVDYCSREGALALKGMIEAYWRGRGQDVMITLHDVGFHPAIRTARFDVRSDMVDGMPRATASMRGVNGADFAKPPVVKREDLGPNDVRQAVRDS